jgi:hypothetical protein
MTRLVALTAIVLSLLATSSTAQVSKEELLTPPPGARSYVIISSAGQHGTSASWTLPDGRLASRFSMNLRGQIFEVDETIRLGANGQPENISIRGFTPNGDSAETFEIKDGKARWKNKIEDGGVDYDGKAQYAPYGGTPAANAYFVESLYRAPGKTLTLLPSGTERLVKLVDIPVGTGTTAKTVTAWAVEGVELQPFPVLLNQDGTYFGFVSVMAALPPDYAGDFLKLQKAQIDALASRNLVNVERFAQVSPVPVAFTHVKMFDAESATFLDNQTVVTSGKTIAAVGAADSVDIPANARVIEGAGKTLSPGIWDAHMHVGHDQQGVMLLSLGETSARDPGADVQPTLLRRARIAKGELVFPTVYSSVLIDGKGPLAAQGGVVVASEEEAVAAVAKAKADGFAAVKFYTSMKPEWLWPAIKEAHKLGLHVHGHIPATLRPTDVIAGGYDEITHINFVMMQAMPDSVVDIDNGIERFTGPGKYAKDVDLDAAPMAHLIAEMAAGKIAVDPTLSTFESLYVPEDGDLSPSYAPFLGTMPPQVERGFREGGFKPPAPVTRAEWRASFAKMVELTKKLHEAGIPIVAGTDGRGLEIIRELELYVQAGFTPGQALQAATIVPARLVGADATTGSILVGKKADLVLVRGDPSKVIGDMRHTEWVMKEGALMNADELRQAAGFSGSPK